MYKVVDLFAGAGGLSQGFLQTKKFKIIIAVENNPNAQKTYLKNHPGTTIMNDVRLINFKEIKEKYGNIDVIIGGPPCQGFSNANRQKNYAISQNNRLVKEYVRAIVELQPKVFVMENVSMLRSEVHRFFYSYNDKQIVDSLNIKMVNDTISLLNKNIKIENVEEIIKNENNINKYSWDCKDYLVLNVLYKSINNKMRLEKTLKKYKKDLKNICDRFDKYNNLKDNMLNYFANVSSEIKAYVKGEGKIEKLKLALDYAINIQCMLKKAKELIDNAIIIDSYDTSKGVIAKVRSYSVYDYMKAVLSSNNNKYIIRQDILNAANFGAPQIRKRFIAIGVKEELNCTDFELPKGHFRKDNYRTVRDAISDIDDVEPNYKIGDPPIKLNKKELLKDSLGEKLRNSEFLYNHVITKNKETALKRFASLKQGQNFHNLDKKMKEDTYSNIERTQNTIYLRLIYDEPSGTVVNVRKSMWIHPIHNRALSIREAARLQTFPDSFIFTGTKDSQYQQVGNAVPPILSHAIALKVYELLLNKK